MSPWARRRISEIFFACSEWQDALVDRKVYWYRAFWLPSQFFSNPRTPHIVVSEKTWHNCWYGFYWQEWSGEVRTAVRAIVDLEVRKSLVWHRLEGYIRGCDGGCLSSCSVVGDHTIRFYVFHSRDYRSGPWMSRSCSNVAAVTPYPCTYNDENEDPLLNFRLLFAHNANT